MIGEEIFTKRNPVLIKFLQVVSQNSEMLEILEKAKADEYKAMEDAGIQVDENEFFNSYLKSNWLSGLVCGVIGNPYPVWETIAEFEDWKIDGELLSLSQLLQKNPTSCKYFSFYIRCSDDKFMWFCWDKKRLLAVIEKVLNTNGRNNNEFQVVA